MRIKKALTLIFLLSFFFLNEQYAQDRNYIDYDTEAGTYEIGGITIEGGGQRDANAVKSVAGLKEGAKIDIPGTQIAKGVKALYRLGIFSNIEVIQDRIEDDVIFLKIILTERPTLSTLSFVGIKKSHADDLQEIVEGIVTKGKIISDNDKELATKKLKEFYIDKGNLDVEVDLSEKVDTSRANSILLEFVVDRKERVKISDITFTGNDNVKDRKVRKLIKETKRKGTLFRKSKYIAENFEEDKKKLIAHYNKNGFRDAEITNDSIWRDEEGLLRIHMDIDEGNQYYFRNITWKGNSIYTDEQLGLVLGITPGEVYNEEFLQKRMSFSLDGSDISSLYLDRGYLFFDVNPTEIAVVNDSIDLEMRINEGPQATIDRVIIKGNDRTKEHVVRREIRTRPGEKFSRSDIVRSQRQIINLGYFNPETLDIQTPVNQAKGTVDIEYTLEETPSDQLELSAGYGGFNGLIGTLGVTFNNFSIQNIGKKESWSPLPQGDGQKFSVRLQSNSRFFRSYNASFTEPWLGGKRPNSFTIGVAHTTFDQSSFGNGSLKITRGFIGLGTQLPWPDDFFVSNTLLNLENITLDQFRTRFPVNTGSFKNFNIRQTIARSSVNEPIYPKRGSKVSLSLQVTPPYSLFRGTDYWIMNQDEKEVAIRDANLQRGFGNPLTPAEEVALIDERETARKFDYLEYHKWRFDAEWYFPIAGNLVMMTSAKIGFLGSYNSKIGQVPFERFEFGGDGLSNQNNGIQGTDIIAARGYESTDYPANLIEGGVGGTDGGVVFNKYTVEIRYPFSTNPNSTIYAHTFLQAGNVWDGFGEFNPFDLKRSVGGGVRVFLPMFGLLGFDYGFGIDKIVSDNNGYGKFSIVLGFEPD